MRNVIMGLERGLITISIGEHYGIKRNVYKVIISENRIEKVHMIHSHGILSL